MKKFILTSILCACTIVNAMAQSCPGTNGIVGIETDDTRAVYTLHGDMTGVTVPHATNKIFTSDAVNEVFTNNTGTSIVAGAAYDAETTYYSATKNWNQLFGGLAPTNDYYNVNNVVSNSTWNDVALSTINIYAVSKGDTKKTWNESKTNASNTYLYPAYKNYLGKITINGSRVISGDYPEYSLGEIDIEGTKYVAYILSSTEKNYGDICEISEVTLLTVSDIQGYMHESTPITIGAKVVGGTYTTPETFTYKDVTYVKYITSTSEISGVINIEDFDGQSLLTNANMSAYVNTTATYNCISDKLYKSTDGGVTKTKLENGQNYTYNAGETFWTYTAEYNAIANNADFFATNASYLTAQPVPVAEYLVEHANAGGYKEVVIESCEHGYATMDQPFTCQLLHLTDAKTLDLRDVQVEEFVGFTVEGYFKDNTTFKWDPNSTTDSRENTSVTTLYLPRIGKTTMVNGKEHRHVPTNLVMKFEGLYQKSLEKHEAKIIMPANATCLEEHAFASLYLTDITLNEGLRMVGDRAFDTMHEDVLVIPSTMEYIGKGAFGQGYVHDVYFLGTTAPIVEMDAFGSKAYVNNDANIQPNTVYDPISGGDVAKNPKYAATRDFYFNGDYAAAVLHLPKNLTAAQRAAYTDVTRDYHVFDTYRNATSEEIATYGQEGSNVIMSSDGLHHFVQIIEGDNHSIEHKYVSSQSSEDLGTCTDASETKDYVMRIFWNGIVNGEQNYTSLGGFQTHTNNCFYSGVPGSEVAGGETSYNDYYVGSVYHWPGQSAYCRSYAVATHNILWDGNTTIAQGIENKGGSYTARTYDINCDGDTDDEGEAKWANGSEYIGLHQFVLVTSDVEPEQTPEDIPFKTIKGGNWYSFCYPVNMTVKQVREVFGPGTQVCKFNQVDRVVEGDGKIIKLYFTDEQCLGKGDINNIAIEANVSYMIRPSYYFDEDDVNYSKMYFKFTDYELSGRQVPQETNVTAHDISDGGSVEGDVYTFIGQYMTQADGTALTMPKYSYFLRNASASGTKVKDQIHKLSFQGGTTGKWNVNTSIVIPANGQEDKDTFFTGTSAQNLAKTTTFFGFTEKDIPTEVEEVKYEMVLGAENSPGGIYNLNGQLVGNTTVGLTKGIYIQAGKKFIVR